MESEAVRDYLADLDAAAGRLPADRKAELLADVRDHIALALDEAGRTDEATVGDVLGRLGTPVEIVAAETTLETATVGAEPSRAVASTRAPRRPLTVETRALLFLTVGSIVLPFIGPALGLWVAAGSTRWTLGQKRTAAMIFLVLSVVPFTLVVPSVISGEVAWLPTTAGYVLPLIPLAGLVPAVYLVVSSSLVVIVSRRP